ncbi:tripartite tricarboxylate transporter substrate binding protein [Desulforhopalus sp. IMCC35007]|uniref:Bug family tripartite tricarboxylate transporter substrate binding protein n=1 Tax=Desulforhopalus sp. IMCC35007 TaxID=2569543 RepID=UPI001F0D6C7B|nr:tripartite tricarboxylate transporter substrate binding protein [Desulforhopalus sp. IMCC35007]
MMRKLLALATVLFFALPGLLQAAYPEKPITIIIPSKAGGSTDTSARIFIKTAKKLLPGADFIIKNVPGSGGQKGFEEIARAKPDGYTIGMIFTTQVVSHVVAKRARYTLDSFHIIGNMMQDPLIIAVPKDSPITDMKGFVEAAKAKALTVAVNGIGSDDFVAAKKFENNTGVTFNLLPTKGSTEQKSLVLGGHVDASFMNLTQMHGQHKSGDARIIAILDDNRSDIVPDVPTSIEQGFTVNMTATRGFAAPAGIEKNVADTLDKLVMDVMNDPEFIEDCKKDVLFLLPLTGPNYLAYLKDLQAETQKFFDSTPW